MTVSTPVISVPVIEGLVDTAVKAGDAILAIYGRKAAYELHHKGDASPLTAADLAAHKVIREHLMQLLALPLVSEESTSAEIEQRLSWPSYWLVDPLDGTQEFLAGNGEFTVNIALIHRHKPVVGVVHWPVKKVTYLGVVDATFFEGLGFEGLCIAPEVKAGAWKYEATGQLQKIHVNSLTEKWDHQMPLVVLASHRHGTQATKNLLAGIAAHWPGPVEVTQAGSSLKFCLIAEGKADFYPRLAPTSEWDTAAAQAVLEAAGGLVVEVPHEKFVLNPLEYNRKNNLLNSQFYALGDKKFDWSLLLSDRR